MLYYFHSKGSGWKIVASFEGKFPDRIKQLPLDRHFDLNNVKRVNSKAAVYLIIDWAFSFWPMMTKILFYYRLSWKRMVINLI